MTLTVNEAAAKSQVTAQTVLGWIRTKKINAQKEGVAYRIDTASLSLYLTNRNTPKTTACIIADRTALKIFPDGKNSLTDTPSRSSDLDPPDLTAPATLPPSAVQLPSLNVSEPEQHEKRQPSFPSVPVKEEGGLACARVAAFGSKKAINRIRHEKGKRIRKGPVRYVKDTMRHFDLVQLRDVRDWVLHRMDQQMKSA